MVWRKCDGLHTVAEIAKLLETEMKILGHDNQFQYFVSLEVNKLKHNKLIKDPFGKAEHDFSIPVRSDRI